MIKFNKFNVTNGTLKARVSYSLDNRMDGRKCVTIYAKDYNRDLGRMLPEEYFNDTDASTDYFEMGRVVLFETSPHYDAARAAALGKLADDAARFAVNRAKLAVAYGVATC